MKQWILLAGLLLIPTISRASYYSISVDSANQGGTTSVASTLSYNHLVGPNATILVAGMEVSTISMTFQSVTFAGLPPTGYITNQNNARSAYAKVLAWWINPPQGSYQLLETVSGSGHIMDLQSISYNNVANVTPTTLATDSGGVATGTYITSPIMVNSTYSWVVGWLENSLVGSTAGTGTYYRTGCCGGGGLFDSNGPVFGSVSLTALSTPELWSGTLMTLAPTSLYNPTIYASQAITINSTQVSGTQNNFVVLISTTQNALRSVSNGGHVQNINGYDIVFSSNPFSTSTINILLPYDVKTYNPVIGQLAAFVQVPSINSVSSGTVYMGYDDPNATSYQGSNNLSAVYGSNALFVDHDNNEWLPWNNVNPVIANGNSSSFDYSIANDPHVVLDTTTAVMNMFYGGLNSAGYAQIGRSTSTDGVNWTKVAGNPVLSTGAASAWDGQYVGKPSLVEDPSGNFWWMFYGGVSTGASLGVETFEIGVASAPNLNGPWTKYSGNPIMVPNGSVYEGSHLDCPSVIYENGVWKMWYSGNTVILGEPDYINLATAASPTSTWYRYAENPLLLPTGNNPDQLGYAIGGPRVFKVPGTASNSNPYLMVYNAFDDPGQLSRTFYLTSPDGFSWQQINSKDVSGLGIYPSTIWNSGMQYRPTYLSNGTTQYIWANGRNSSGNEQIGLFTIQSTTTAKIGSGAVLLNGSYQFFEPPQFINLGSSGTITSWINFQGQGTPDAGGTVSVFDNLDSTSKYGWSFGLRSATQKIDFYLANNGNFGNEDLSNATLSTGTWHLVKLAYGGAGKQIYVDGVLDSSFTSTVNGSNPGATMVVGARNSSTAFRPANIILDESRIYLNEDSPSYAKTEYNNESNPAAFESFGVESSTPIPSAPQIINKINGSNTSGLFGGLINDSHSLFSGMMGNN